jgi:hypothetical protein
LRCNCNIGTVTPQKLSDLPEPQLQFQIPRKGVAQNLLNGVNAYAYRPQQGGLADTFTQIGSHASCDLGRAGLPTKGDTMSHEGFLARTVSLLALGGAIATCAVAYGQQSAAVADQAAADTDASAANTNSLEEVVVTGTATAGGVKKLDASFSITTASLEEIRDVGPSSSADLLKIVPGVWPETSGGESGSNIELAGYPSGSDAPYVTYQINGSPIYPVPTLSFMDNSAQFRIDESVERAEVLQGGPPTVSSAQPRTSSCDRERPPPTGTSA